MQLPTQGPVVHLFGELAELLAVEELAGGAGQAFGRGEAIGRVSGHGERLPKQLPVLRTVSCSCI